MMKTKTKNNKKTNKYIEFLNRFTDTYNENGKTYPTGVKFRISNEDSLYYYISNGNIKIDKQLEGEHFKTAEIVYGG